MNLLDYIESNVQSGHGPAFLFRGEEYHASSWDDGELVLTSIYPQGIFQTHIVQAKIDYFILAGKAKDGLRELKERTRSWEFCCDLERMGRKKVGPSRYGLTEKFIPLKEIA